MLNIKNLKLAFGPRVLLEDATVQMYKGQKVGLIGQNGAGKTTLFKLILGKMHAEAGDYSLTNGSLIAYVEQEIDNATMPLVDYVLSVHPLILEDLTYLPEYYQLRPNAEKLLINLGFSQEELYQPLSNFSGGWQMRVNLAKALFIPSDLLLLDEPTNHLDLETVIWLEDWLKQYQGLAIIISHDREFLDNITTHTLALSNKTLTLYGGNYSTFENTRYQQLQQQQQILAKNQAKRAHLESFVERFRAKASKAKQAQSRLKMIEKLGVAQALPKDIEFSIQFLEPEYKIDKLLGLNHCTIGYPTKTVLKDVKLDIFQSSRIGLLGKNGIGKSTFIKALIDKSTLLSGEYHIDNKIKIGYFAQHTVDQLDLDDTPLTFLSRQHKNKKEQEIRAYLGKYGFQGDKVKERIGTFSGGEKARLTIASIILQRPNILFLDEPTNHLDMQMREELSNSIQDFEGSVIIVSHDKFLLQSVVDEFYLIHDLTLAPFAGDLDDYHDWLLKQNALESKSSKAKNTKATNTGQPKNPLKIKDNIDKAEKQIARLNQKIIDFANFSANLDSNSKEDHAKLQQLTIAHTKDQEKLMELEAKWLELQAELDGCNI